MKSLNLNITIDPEKTQDSGRFITFYCHVREADGCQCQDIPVIQVPIKSEFYRELRKQPNWKDELMVIINQRVADAIRDQRRKNSVSMNDLFTLGQYPHQL